MNLPNMISKIITYIYYCSHKTIYLDYTQIKILERGDIYKTQLPLQKTKFSIRNKLHYLLSCTRGQIRMRVIKYEVS